MGSAAKETRPCPVSVFLNHLPQADGELEVRVSKGPCATQLTTEVHRLTQMRQPAAGTFYKLITRTRTIPSLSGIFKKETIICYPLI